MKTSKFTDSQIMAILKQNEAGISVQDLCREHSISSATFYKWRAKYGGMDTAMIKRLKELEDENRRLKKMYAEECLKSQIRQEALEGKVVKPSLRKEMAQQVVAKLGLSIRLACEIFGISETCYRHQAKLSNENAVIADWLLRLTTANKRWGFGLCFDHLRNVKKFSWNHKRVYRLYRELELNLRIKPRRRIKRDKPDALSVPTGMNQVWSMDFMSDALDNGRKFRTFNVIDDYNREGLCIDVDFSMPSQRVIRSLEQVMEWRGKPAAIRCDNGPENISQVLIDWANNQKITLMYIQPGKPTQNAYVERFNRTVRHEWLELHLFESVEQAQLLATQWLWTYNNERPNSAIGRVPPR
ncbi:MULTISPECIES: IS3 family transposase [unclassified Methylophaga]|uniref:IS3 family transposase n=1 Tax=unclassified Methylophaga TaxID=2629249 RepID=UPI000C8C7926|nr:MULTISPECIES: IS3 family transposase [unclassified Methylophaga]MAL49609.1 IS3 family transposase [Methylophaga sp.]